MRLLNFSTGRVQTVTIGDEPVRTAHVKSAVPQPWIVTEDGAAGDERAVHPDKLYAFAREGYDHWGRELGVDPTSWLDGFFGENLTLDRLDESDVRIGDEFELGREVRLIVTGSRTPCLKLSWRLGQPRSFQKTFALSRRTGVYLGVLATGRVQPGDVLRRTVHDPSMPSVADLCGYIAGREPPPLDAVERLLAFPRLSGTIRLLLSAKLDSARRAATLATGGWAGWRSFQIAEIVEETADIRSVRLVPKNGDRLPRPRPGQHVAVRFNDSGDNVIRRWSLSEHGDDPESFRLTVRRGHGPGSRRLHGLLKGDRVELRSPAGAFTLDEGSYRPLVLVAAGVGITPLLAMLHAQLRRPGAAPTHLIYAGRTPDDMALRAEVDALAADHPALTVHYIYSRSQLGPLPPGRVTADLLLSFLDKLHVVLDGHRIELPWFEADIYICGPGDLCRELPTELARRGGNADHIHTEQFDAPLAVATDIDFAQVRFARSARVAIWHAEDAPTLLDLAEASGVRIDNECRQGSCQTCKTRVIDGSTTMDLEGGWTLPCIARPTTRAVVLEV